MKHNTITLCQIHVIVRQPKFIPSTADAVAYLFDIVAKNLDDNAKNYARCRFIAFTSAFNTTNPIRLIVPLISTPHSSALYITFSPNVNRPNWSCHPPSTTNIGGPQGCVLGSLLFSSTYVQHNMPTPSSDNTQFIKYADDAVLTELLYNKNTSCMDLAASSLSRWCLDNGLILHVTKSNEIFRSNLHFHPSHKPTSEQDSCTV